MDKIKVYNLIDSLLAVFSGSVEGLGDRITEGINGFLEPISIYFYLEHPDMATQEKLVGDLTHKDIFIKYGNQVREMNIDSADFALSGGERAVISCAAFQHVRNIYGLIMVMTDRNHPLKHIIRQVLELYQANILLGLTTISQSDKIDWPFIIELLFDELKTVGVKWIIGYEQSNPDFSHWCNGNGATIINLNSELRELLNSSEGRIDKGISKKLLSNLPDKEIPDRIIVDSCGIGERSFRCAFAGNYKNDDVVFSKFRSKLNDTIQPSGYNEIVDAFSKLKKDHKLIVKGERIAAILETAVALNHEINNPLTAVLGNTQLLLLQKDNLPQDVVSKINTIEKSAIRIREVTQKLMKIVEPITTNYTNNLDMLDIEKSANDKKENEKKSQ